VCLQQVIVNHLGVMPTMANDFQPPKPCTYNSSMPARRERMKSVYALVRATEARCHWRSSPVDSCFTVVLRDIKHRQVAVFVGAPGFASSPYGETRGLLAHVRCLQTHQHAKDLQDDANDQSEHEKAEFVIDGFQ